MARSIIGIPGRVRERTDALGKRKNRLVRPRWLALRRTKPLSDIWGADRGTPIDRYYIERFLHQNRQTIRGDVLEIKHPMYTDRFGVGVASTDVLDIDPANERANIVADLAQADSVPDRSFDCFILTQTLQYVYDVRAAVSHCHRILRPGGVLLCTVPSVSGIDPGSLENEYWRFTAASCSRLFGDAFDGGRGSQIARQRPQLCILPGGDRGRGAPGTAAQSRRRLLPAALDRARREGCVSG